MLSNNSFDGMSEMSIYCDADMSTEVSMLISQPWPVLS